MRLTADVILHARTGINPCEERELDLRGYKIPMIENLGVTQDQFDAIDFSDNEIKRLDNFPRYSRLSSLLMCNNHISRIASDIGTQLPNLSCLILTNNKLLTLGDLDGLRSCKKLEMLSLLHNEVMNKQYYRLYTIHLVPSLKQLDFQKVTMKERASAARLAGSQAGQSMMKDVAKETEKSKTFTPGGGAPTGVGRLTDEHRRIYAERIEKAATVEEVEMLTRKFQAGIIPSATYKQGGGAVANGAAPAADSVHPAESTAAGNGSAKRSAGVMEPSGDENETSPDAAPDAGTSATGKDSPVETSPMDVEGDEEGPEKVGGEKENGEGQGVHAPTAEDADEEPAAEEDGAGDDEEPAAKEDGAGDDEEPAAEEDGAGDDEEPAAEEDGTGDDEEPAAEEDGTGDDEEPAAEEDGASMMVEEAAETDESAAGANGNGQSAGPISEGAAAEAAPAAAEAAPAAAEAAPAAAEAAPAAAVAAATAGEGETQGERGGEADVVKLGSGAGEEGSPPPDAKDGENGETIDGEEGGEDGVVDRSGKEEEGEKASVETGDSGSMAGEDRDGSRDDEEEQQDESERERPEGEGAKCDLSEAKIRSFKVPELKKKLLELELSTDGLKGDLQARLLEAVATGR